MSTADSRPLGFEIGKRDLIAVGILTCAWILCVFVIDYRGDFPLNDDSAYALAVESFLEKGTFERTSWTWTPTISNILVGATSAKIFGFSHEALRLSTIVWGLIGCLGAYWLCRQCGAGVKASALGAALTAFNPIYLNLSYTFMTDVPFTGFVILSLASFRLGLTRRSWVALGVGSAFTVAAFLSRQPGIAIPAAVAVAGFLCWFTKPKRLLIFMAWCAGLGLVYVIACESLFGDGDAGTNYTLWYHVRAVIDSDRLAHYILKNLATIGLYLGIIAFPILLLVDFRQAKFRRILAAASVVVGILIATKLIVSGRIMPVSGNIVYDLGVGPATLSNAYYRPKAPVLFWQVVTVCAGLGAAGIAASLLAFVCERGRKLLKEPGTLLLLAFPAIYVAGIVTTRIMWDRYLLPVLPGILALLLGSWGGIVVKGRARYAAAVALTVAMAVFGVLGTRDYLNHHRARQAVVERLVAEGAPAEEIDAGFEYRSWRRLDIVQHYHKRRSAHVHRFVVSYSERLEGYRPLFSTSYPISIPPREETITAHERIVSGNDGR